MGYLTFMRLALSDYPQYHPFSYKQFNFILHYD